MSHLAAFALLLATALAATPALAQTPHGEIERDFACPADRRAEAQAELEQMRAEDQGIRTSGGGPDDMSRTDLDRRKEVAALFAEGCLSTGRDFHNAAPIYQHGTTPEHYYQAYVWARRAVDHGDDEAAWLIPRAVDRYLMNTGYKQLYATNLVSASFFDPDAAAPGTWCLWPTSDAVDDETREALGVATLAAQIERSRDMNNGADGGQCDLDLPDPPHGLFPGLW